MLPRRANQPNLNDSSYVSMVGPLSKRPMILEAFNPFAIQLFGIIPEQYAVHINGTNRTSSYYWNREFAWVCDTHFNISIFYSNLKVSYKMVSAVVIMVMIWWLDWNLSEVLKSLLKCVTYFDSEVSLSTWKSIPFFIFINSFFFNNSYH